MKSMPLGLAFLCDARAMSRSLMYGLMNEVSAIEPESAKSLATSPMRRMFSARS